MANLNQCQFIGNVGKQPEVRYSPSGDAICNFSLAVNENWKDKTTGEKKESTEWVRIVTYRKLAEICGEYLKAGSPVWVQGKLKTRKWQDKDTGQDRYSTEIIADQMQMLAGGPREQSTSTPQAPRQQQRPTAPAQHQQAQQPTSNFDDMDDDIPF